MKTEIIPSENQIPYIIPPEWKLGFLRGNPETKEVEVFLYTFSPLEDPNPSTPKELKQTLQAFSYGKNSEGIEYFENLLENSEIEKLGEEQREDWDWDFYYGDYLVPCKIFLD